MTEFLRNIYKFKSWLMGWCAISLLVSLAVAIALPDKYTSRVALMPVEENTSSLNTSGLGGLASIAGFNLGTASTDKGQLALELLKDWSFIDNFIDKYNLKPEVLAVEKWDAKSGDLVFDETLFDSKSGQWLVNEPNDWAAFQEFKKILIVRQEKNSPVVYVSLTHFSPEISKKWLDWLLKEMNLKIQLMDLNEFKKSIQYLNDRVEKTDIAEMRVMFYELMQEQTKKLMLAEVRDEYVFRKLGDVKTPERKSEPKRAIVVVMGAFLGILLGLFVISLIPWFKQLKNELTNNRTN